MSVGREYGMPEQWAVGFLPGVVNLFLSMTMMDDDGVSPETLMIQMAPADARALGEQLLIAAETSET